MTWKYSKQIVVGHRPDGKQVRKRIYANSKTELNREMYKALSEFENAKPDSNITFREYADHWLKTYKGTKEAATQEMYRNVLAKTGSIDHMCMKDIRQSDLQLIITRNASHPNACAKIRLAFRQIWACAVSEGILSSDITERLETPKTGVKQGRALTKDEKTAIREAELNDEERMFISLLYFLGVRPQEALALMPDDFTKETVGIKRAVGYDGNKPYIKTTKTGNIRTLPIPDSFQPFLQNYLKNLDAPYLLHRNNKLMTKTVKSDLWLRIKKKIEQKLGYKTDMRPYTFRHNYATVCYYSGISLKKCQQLMGHNSLQMIMKVYAHLDDEQENIDRLKNLTF